MDDYITPDSGSTPVEKQRKGLPLFDFLQRIDAQGDAIKGWRGKCPVHDDTRPSLTINLDKETGVPLVHCFVCQGNTVPGLMVRGLWPLWVPDKAKIEAHGKKEKFNYEWLPRADGAVPEPPTVTGHVLAGQWDYLDVDGNVMGRVYRFDALADPDPGKKRAKQFRPHFYFMAHDGPTWMLKMPSPRPLYNLQSLSNPGPVMLVEGEKACDAAQKRWPHRAILSPMGGLQGLASSDLSALKNHDIIIWPDADQKWEENALSWRNVLVKSQVKSVHRVTLPEGLPSGWDLADEVPEGIDVDEILEELYEYRISNRDPIGSITRAEDLKTSYVHVGEGGEKNTFVFIETGHEMSQAVFDATFRNLTVPRDLGLPYRYYLEAKDRIASCAGKTYEPGKPRLLNGAGSQLFNSYSAPNISPLPGDVKPLLDHVHYLLVDDDANELLNRFANMLQNPRRRPLSAFVLIGKQGTGKNILFEAFKPLVGEENFWITDPESVFSSYNYYAANKVMLVFNEMTDYEKHELYDRVKQLITDRSITVRQKYRPEYEVRNYSHVFCMTNHARPIRLPDEMERRFYIAKSIVDPQPHEYYARLISWLRTHQAQILNYFLEYKLKDWDPEARPKLTEAKKEVVLLSKPVTEQRFEEMLSSDELQYDLYPVEPFYDLLFKNGALGGKFNFMQAKAMLDRHGVLYIDAAKQFPNGKNAKIKLICLRDHEKYLTMGKLERWRAMLAERNDEHI